MKPTEGPWILGNENNSCAEVCLGDSDLVFSISRESSYTGKMQISREEMLANVSLVMEAGTVYHETGLTPREILAQRDELRNLLWRIDAVSCGREQPPEEYLDDTDALRWIWEQIQKAQNTTPELTTPA
jgi:hypothetical protein